MKVRGQRPVALRLMDLSYVCRDVRVDVGSRRVLDGVSFVVGRGEFVSIMGSSGVGKTTLLRTLAGLQRSVAGSTVRLEGVDVVGPPERVSLVFQDYSSSLLPWRTVARNVELPLEREVKSKAERRARVDEALEMVGLGDRGADRPFELSGGMQQRVQIARALVSRPAVVLMDEPFGAVDALTKASLEDQLLELVSLMGTTVVFVTHDMDEAVYLSDRVLVLGGAPAAVVAEVEVGCPRPRSQLSTRSSAEFLYARRSVHEAIFGCA